MLIIFAYQYISKYINKIRSL